MDKPKTLQQAIRYFSDEQVCIDTIAELRWPNARPVQSAATMSTIILPLKSGGSAASAPSNSQLSSEPFSKILPSRSTNGLSHFGCWLTAKTESLHTKVGRDLGITQKSAWFVLHRLRLALQNGSIMKIGGEGTEVEVDETFIGGKARNMHHGSARRNRLNQTGVTGKTAIVGLLERGGEVRATVVPTRRKKLLQGHIKDNVNTGALLYTDAFMSYMGLDEQGYIHKVIDHAERYADGRVHTNGMENFWSLLKRGIRGTYVNVEPFHLFRYLDEQAWRFNNRATKDRPMKDADRFNLALSTIAGKRLTFAEVTGKVGSSEALQ